MSRRSMQALGDRIIRAGKLLGTASRELGKARLGPEERFSLASRAEHRARNAFEAAVRETMCTLLEALDEADALDPPTSEATA